MLKTEDSRMTSCMALLAASSSLTEHKPRPTGHVGCVYAGRCRKLTPGPGSAGCKARAGKQKFFEFVQGSDRVCRPFTSTGHRARFFANGFGEPFLVYLGADL